MASQRAHQKFIAEGPGEPGKQRNIQRLNAINVKRVDILSVVGISHSAAQARSQPVVLLAE